MKKREKHVSRDESGMIENFGSEGKLRSGSEIFIMGEKLGRSTVWYGEV